MGAISARRGQLAHAEVGSCPGRERPIQVRREIDEGGSVEFETTGDEQASWIGEVHQFRWLHGIVKLVLVLNLCDAVFTLIWVYAGLAREANPLIADTLSDSPVLFASAKLGLVGLGSLLLWKNRDRALAVIGIFVAFLVYYLIFLYHVGYLSLLIGTLLFP